MTQQDDRSKLIEAARARVAAGDTKFSIGALCAEAGVERETFRACFTGKSELLAAVASTPVEVPEPVRTPVIELVRVVKPVAQAGAGDAWLERRLRVFERALTALEARAEANSREFQQAILRLEEKISAVGGQTVLHMAVGAENQPVATLAKSALAKTVVAKTDLEIAITAAPVEEPEIPDADEAPAGESHDDIQARHEALMLPLEIPSQEAAPSKEEMAELLEVGRRAARAAEAQIEEKKEKKPQPRLRWFALGGLTLVTMFVCAGITLSNAARTSLDDSESGAGITRRHVAGDAFARTAARADYGDRAAQAELALNYLRGEHGAADSRSAAHWAGQAALGGQAVAQYVMGTLYHNGDGVPADAGRAFAFFTAAADQGNVKAMHNLAIAYAEGLGTAKDPQKAADWFARAAARGYVDSAFDLAVLYERGVGVKQDLREALKWYKVATLEGDQPSQARIDVLTQQLSARDVIAAIHDAQVFMPMKVEMAANILPKF